MKDEQILKRIEEVYKREGLSPSSFAKKIGFNQSNFSKILRGEREIPANLINKIIDNTNVNIDWLRTGEGNMLKENSNAKQFIPRDRVGVPLVSQYAYAGYLGGYGDRSLSRSRETPWTTAPRKATSKEKSSSAAKSNGSTGATPASSSTNETSSSYTRRASSSSASPNTTSTRTPSPSTPSTPCTPTAHSTSNTSSRSSPSSSQGCSAEGEAVSWPWP